MSETPSIYAAALIARGRSESDRLAYSCDGESRTYGELLHDAATIAAGLAGRGVRAGDRVAFVLPAGIPFVRAFAGTLLAGAVPYAIHPGVAPATAAARAARGRPSLVIAAEPELAALAKVRDGLPLAALERLARPAAVPSKPPIVDGEQPLLLQLTSGTTGEPRFAVLSHRAISSWKAQAAGILDPGPDDVLAGWVPPWHITGLMRFVLMPVVTGTPCHLVQPVARELGRWLETAASVRATYTSAPDFALRTAVRMVGDAAIDLSSLRLLTSGGEAVRRSTIEAFETRFGLPGIVRPGYGLAESTLAVTMVRPGERLVVDDAGQVGCGRPLPGVELAIVDERGEPAPEGAAGEIRVRSAALFSGYFESPAGDTTLTADGWLATGDWGRIGENGHLFVIGRRRVLLKHGGATYAPRELEDAAERVAGVRASAAVSLARAGRPEAPGVVMVVELETPEGTPPGSIAEAVAAAVRRDVGVLPAEVLVVAGGVLPRTETGKLRHAELRRAIAAGLDVAAVLHGERTGWVE